MKQTELTGSWIGDLLLDFDEENLLAYSGRGMSGVECLGIRFDGVEDLVSWAFAMGAEGDSTFVRLLSYGVKIDDMGREIVAYWPHLSAPVIENAE